MFIVLPQDYFYELTNYNIHALSQTCTMVNNIYKEKYNTLLRAEYYMIIRKNELDNPYKVYAMLNKIYNGKFSVGIDLFNQVIKECILSENHELFDILCTTLPTMISKYYDSDAYMYTMNHGLFKMACILVKKFNANGYDGYVYISVKAYYTHKEKPYAQDFINSLINIGGFENGLIYYSLYYQDDYYKQVMQQKFVYNSMCNAIAMANVDAVKYMISHFDISQESVINLLHYNIYKNEEIYKLLIDISCDSKKSLFYYITSTKYAELLRIKIVNYLDHNTYFFKSMDDKHLSNISRLDTINKMHKIPIPQGVIDYLTND